ncbi:hypothetical protein C3F00_021020 [Pseudomonas sp. MWU13-2860]|nr:hypothetical protein C3F00_021020 [Pseudomonas sp. MWU13-2860]
MLNTILPNYSSWGNDRTPSQAYLKRLVRAPTKLGKQCIGRNLEQHIAYAIRDTCKVQRKHRHEPLRQLFEKSLFTN